jgi:hypothetical protein
MWDYVRGEGRDENRKLKPKIGKGRARLLGGRNFDFAVDETNVDLARRVMEHNASPEMQGTKNKYCAKDALHLTLAWAKGQKPSDAEKPEASERFLKAIGLEKALAVIHSHHDTKCEHVHIIASMLDKQTGKTYDDFQMVYKLKAAAVEWEREKGQVTERTQWCQDQADAVRAGDWKALHEQLIKGEATISKSRLDLALAFGGKLGPEMDAAREQFVKTNNLLRLKYNQTGKTVAYTTAEIYCEEERIIGAASDLRRRTGFAVSDDDLKAACDNFTLTRSSAASPGTRPATTDSS